MVPRGCAHLVEGSRGFSIADPQPFDSPAAVHHSGYWARDEMNDAFLRWLTTP